MSGIPEATPIILTEAKGAELKGLARSTKTEYRLRQRARIVLLSARNMASRAIGREVGCTTGTASKWRCAMPTRASWLNQIEIWFSILAGQSLAGASFTSVAQLRTHIDSFIEAYNENAKPSAWTKSEVHQTRLKARFADQ
jgi:hypothetical protein